MGKGVGKIAGSEASVVVFCFCPWTSIGGVWILASASASLIWTAKYTLRPATPSMPSAPAASCLPFSQRLAACLFCRYESAKRKGEFDSDSKRRENAKHCLERYMHYFERWDAHHKARDKVWGRCGRGRGRGGDVEARRGLRENAKHLHALL